MLDYERIQKECFPEMSIAFSPYVPSTMGNSYSFPSKMIFAVLPILASVEGTEASMGKTALHCKYFAEMQYAKEAIKKFAARISQNAILRCETIKVLVRLKRNKMKKTILFLAGILMLVQSVSAKEFHLGYRVMYSANDLHASKIDSAFPDIPAGGHHSAFFMETPIWKDIRFMMAPGAGNSEKGNSRLTMQYNLFALEYRMNTFIFPVAGFGTGGGIVTLSNGEKDEAQVTPATLYHTTDLLWTANAGIGYRFKNGMEIVLEERSLGFILDPNLTHLNSHNLAFAIGWKISGG